MKTIGMFRSVRKLGQFREESTAHHNRSNLAGLICTVGLKCIPVGWNRHLRMGLSQFLWSNYPELAESDIGLLRITAAPVLYVLGQLYSQAELFKAGLRKPRVSVKFEFKFESLKSSSVFWSTELMIGGSKNNGENYLRKCF